MNDDFDSIAGIRSLRGVAIGDSLGLPYEGLSAKRGIRLLPFPLRQRLVVRWGFVSDDTVQSALVLTSLAKFSGDPERCARDFSDRLRVWFLSIPPGIGLATIRACLKICFGSPPNKSGVYSAGNGAAMRAAVIGAAWATNSERRIQFVNAISRVTHTHPLAVDGAQIIALAAALTRSGRAEDFQAMAKALVPDWPWEATYPSSGPTGYVVHSVNAAISIWKSSGDFQIAIEKTIKLGGDTDTVAAMVGGIIAAGTEPINAPTEWNRIAGWPQPKDEASILAGARTPYVRLLLANAIALPFILGHGFRRLLPPY